MQYHVGFSFSIGKTTNLENCTTFLYIKVKFVNTLELKKRDLCNLLAITRNAISTFSSRNLTGEANEGKTMRICVLADK